MAHNTIIREYACIKQGNSVDGKNAITIQVIRKSISYYDMYTVKVWVRQLSLRKHDVLLQNVSE